MKHKFEEALPDYETYKHMSCIVLGPKKTTQKKSEKSKKESYFQEPQVTTKRYSILLNNTIYEPKIINNLRALYNQYSDRFIDICVQILHQKYKLINKNIYKYCVAPFSYNNGMMGSLILNTDQNRQEFFTQLQTYIKAKVEKKKDKFDMDNIFTIIYPVNFNALDKLFAQLKIDDDEIIDNKDEQLSKIVVFYDIQSVNSVVFNIFISRIMEYNRRQFPKYNYILIFDIAYDPKILYDKFNVSFLSKIQFYTITNTPSNCLYHEILYNFIYKNNSGFYIPKSESIKEVLNSIDLHQISIESFKHYFNLILFQFFFMHQWNDDEFLLYMDELNEDTIKKELNIDENINNETSKDKKSSKKKSSNDNNIEKLIDNKRQEIIEKKLEDIYLSSNELSELTKKYKLFPSKISNEAKKLVQNYKDKMNNWKIFKLFYELFEGFIVNYLPNDKNGKDNIYYFLYNFLQYDSSSEFEIIIKKRASSITEILKKILGKSSPMEALKDYFAKNFEKTRIKVEPLLCEEDKCKLAELKIELDNFIKSFEKMDIKRVPNIPDEFGIWVKKLLTLNCFKKINEADDEQIKENSVRKYCNVYHRYTKYKDMIEPSLMKNFLSSLYNYYTDNGKGKASLDIKENSFDFKNILKAYFKCLMNLDSNFKLNNFFYDFLIEFKITEINDKNKDLVEEYKKLFLVLSYWFNLVGVFQKKKGKKHGFIKNYYKASRYFDDPKDKNFVYPHKK